MVRKYIPAQGDLVFLNFTPGSGHEQLGPRPALVLSPGAYNEKSGLMIACPVTSQIKGYPFEVDLGAECKLRGVILADQVKSLDWRARRVRFVERAQRRCFEETLGKLQALLRNG